MEFQFNIKENLKIIFAIKLFENVKNCHPDFKSKLIMIEGDLLLPNLGISKDDRKQITDNVSIVFHSAATVRFDEPLK